MSSKSHLSKWKTYFSQFIEKFLKIQEVKYLINYVKFKMCLMCLALCSANSLFLMLDLNVALGLSNFSHDKRDKKMEFSRLDPVW